MQNASKVIVGVVCGLVALTFVCVLALSPQNSVQAPVNSAPTASSEKASSQIPSSVPEANAKVTRYIIKSEGNSLCVYCEGEDAPIKTVELDVSPGGPGAFRKGDPRQQQRGLKPAAGGPVQLNGRIVRLSSHSLWLVYPFADSFRTQG